MATVVALLKNDIVPMGRLVRQVKVQSDRTAARCRDATAAYSTMDPQEQPILTPRQPPQWHRAH
jgi:hypothetical protein